jgi:hypothetical protein
LALHGALDPVGLAKLSDPGVIFLDRYRRFLREERLHGELDDRTPAEVEEEYSLWSEMPSSKAASGRANAQ